MKAARENNSVCGIFLGAINTKDTWEIDSIKDIRVDFTGNSRWFPSSGGFGLEVL